MSERCDAKSQRESILLVDLKDEGNVEEQVMRRERYPSVDRDRSRGSGAVGLCHATEVKSFTELSTFQVSARAWRRVLCAVALSLRPAGLLLGTCVVFALSRPAPHLLRLYVCICALLHALCVRVSREVCVGLGVCQLIAYRYSCAAFLCLRACQGMHAFLFATALCWACCHINYETPDIF